MYASENIANRFPKSLFKYNDSDGEVDITNNKINYFYEYYDYVKLKEFINKHKDSEETKRIVLYGDGANVLENATVLHNALVEQKITNIKITVVTGNDNLLSAFLPKYISDYLG